MREFRLLKSDEIECRVQSQNAKGVTLLLYKTARTDSKLLDETYGVFGWQNKYEVINDNLYCSIGILDTTTGQWIWKSNCGVESNTEKEKGEASDSFKRAGFTWGIGTELYSSPFIWISAEDIEMVDGKCRSKFEVAAIGYDKDENINHLVINASDRKGKNRQVFSFGGKATTKTQTKAKEEPKTPPVAKCELCGNDLKPAKRRDGTVLEVSELFAESKKRTGKCLCASCLAKELKK